MSGITDELADLLALFPEEPGVPWIHLPSFPVIPAVYGTDLCGTLITFIVIKWFPSPPCPDLPFLSPWGLGTILVILVFPVIVTEPGPQ